MYQFKIYRHIFYTYQAVMYGVSINSVSAIYQTETGPSEQREANVK